jgi:ATP-dependent Lon protease
VIIPQRNEKDLDDVPEEVRKELKFILADRVEDVLAAALEKPLKKRRLAAQPDGRTGHAGSRKKKKASVRN